MIPNALDIQKTVFQTVGFAFDGPIEYRDFDGVEVTYDGHKAVLGANSKAALARCCFLLAQNISAGKQSFHITQRAHFDSCGVMLDMSRNGVMKVESVKRYINHLAALGLNLLMLYMEDTYELADYPLFGYMRGRYSVAELKEIDDYADSLGIEVVPCIQTLGHMAQYLHWPSTEAIRDTEDILLIDEPKTYELIDAMLKTLSGAFRSRRIHIGMDEAHNVGLGAYLRKHGLQDRFEVLNRHLSKVVDLCSRYRLRPMMWSDMYFRLADPAGDYYTQDVEVPDKAGHNLPQVDMVYWDYYATEEAHYNRMIEKHGVLGQQVVFAGGIWTWEGFLEDTDFNFRSMVPALKQCLAHNIQTVIATAWEDDGCETNHFQTLSSLPLFSEYCYLGADCTLEDIASAARYLTGFSIEEKRHISKFHRPVPPERNVKRCGKLLLNTDLFYDLSFLNAYYQEIYDGYQPLIQLAKQKMEQGDRNTEYYTYAYQLLSIAAEKTKLLMDIRPRYQAGDRAYFTRLAQQGLPVLIERYRDVYAMLETMWHRDYKPFGFEAITARFGGAIARLEYIAKRAAAFGDGAIGSIDELEQPLYQSKEAEQWYRSTSYRCNATVSQIF